VLAGRYRLEERVRTGPDGSTWRAVDETLEQPVLVQAFVPGHRQGAEIVDAARRAALVPDPRLQRVLAAGQERGTSYVVLERVPGRTLVELLGGGPLPAEAARRIVGEAAQALDRASTRGLHHVTLRPDSIIVGRDATVTVCGTAVDAAADGTEPPNTAVARRADAIGLVTVLYAALTGRWPGPRDAGLPRAPRVGGRVVAPGDLVAGVPNDLDTLCAVTLGPYDDGPRSPADVAAELAPWASPGPLTDPRGLQIENPRPDPRSHPASSAPGPRPRPVDETGRSRPGGRRTPAWGLRAARMRSRAASGPAAAAPAGALAPGAAVGGPLAATPPPGGGPLAWWTPPAGGPVQTTPPAGGPLVSTAPPGLPLAANAPPGVRTPPPARAPAPAPGAAAPVATPSPDPAEPVARPRARHPDVAAATSTPVGARVQARVGTGAPSTTEVQAAPSSPPDAGDGQNLLRSPPAPPNPGGVGPAGTAAGADTSSPAAPPGTSPPPARRRRRPPMQPRPRPAAPEPLIGVEALDILGAAAQPVEPVAPFGPVTPLTRPPREQSRLVVTVLAVLVLVVGLFAVTRFLTFDAAPLLSSGAATPATPAATAGTPPGRAASPSSTGASPGSTVSVAGAAAIDPQGDGNENGDLAKNVIDGDLSTSWHSERYDSPSFGGIKQGVGLALELGETSTVTAVTVHAPGDDGSVQLRSADSGRLDGSQVIATGELNGSGTVTLSPGSPTATRYLILWFTRVPRNGGERRIVVDEVDVR